MTAMLVFAFWLMVPSNHLSQSADEKDEDGLSWQQPKSSPKKRKHKPVISSWVVKCKKNKKDTCKGFKSCPSCRYKLSLTDPHRYCLRCLGRKHDMTTCKSCLSLSRKSFRARFISHYLWSILPPVENLPDKPPNSRVSTNTHSQAIIELDGEQKFCEIVGKATNLNEDLLLNFSPNTRSEFNSSSTSSLPFSPSESSAVIRRHSSSSSSSYRCHPQSPRLPPSCHVGCVNVTTLLGASLEERHLLPPSTNGLRET